MTLFRSFADLNDALAATTRKLEKRALISGYLKGISVEDAGRAALWISGAPFAETDPRVLNIGGSLLSKAVAQLSGAAEHSMGAAYRRQGDLGAAAADLLAGHAPAEPTLTLTDVEDAFGGLAEARGPVAKLRLLLDLLARATPVESKYLIKLASGDMRTGVRQSLVEEAIADTWSSDGKAPPDLVQQIRRADMHLGSLPEVVALTAAHRLDQARMKLFHPLGFMLASPVASVDEAIARFSEEIVEEQRQQLAGPDGNDSEGNLPVTVKNLRGDKNETALAAAQLEDKFDGIRAQLHLDGKGRVALYSRNREDLSAAFPDLVEAFSGIEESAILDGEILAWNESAARAMPFSALQQRLGRKRVTEEMRRAIPAVLVVFDLLYCGEDLLLEEPLGERRSRLDRFAERWSPVTAALHAQGQTSLFAEERLAFARLIPARATRLATVEQLDRAYGEARERGNEGVMIKSLASQYQPGRRGLAWLKLKRELATLDVVVTGVEYGNGRRAAVLSDYTFAVRDPGDPDLPLKNVGKAYSGLTDQEIAEMTDFFKAHTLWDNGHFRKVEPVVVLEVAFNNVMRSSRHASGFALRFPRILRIRNDKPVEEADTVARVEEIYNSQPDRPVEES
jgi:DNA ligase-1